ncbi:hypothetical protein [Endozoicomonas sp.]|uniref:hypothetical protein n=1 Tax=Endozoicomonas sp. TaxID=1892382 RepID=UPI003AF95079
MPGQLNQTRIAMNIRIFFFVKVFDNEQYAEEFIKGRLFANRLSYFRKLEEGENANRSDFYEGLYAWHQPDQIRFEINGREITDIAGPVSVQNMHCDSLNLFCIYTAHNGGFENTSFDSLEALKKAI